MSDGTKTRRIDFILGAKDEATRVVKEATTRMKKELAEVSRASIPLASSASDRVALAFPKPNRSADEQQIRDMMAGRMRAMRDAAKRASMQDEISRRLFGDPEPEKAKFDPSAAEGMSAFGKSDASARGRAMARGGSDKDWYKSLKAQMDGFENIGKLMKGIGALGIVSEIGRAMQAVPAAIEKYKEAVSQGVHPVQAFAEGVANAIPVVGDLARGFQAVGESLRHSMYGDSFEQTKEKTRAEVQSQKEAREAQNAKNQARRGQLIGDADNASRDAGRRRALGMATGAEKDRLSAQFEYEDKLRSADALYWKGGMVGKSEDKDRIQNAAKQQKIAAEQEYRQRLKEIDDKFNEQANAADGEFRRQAEKNDQETEQSKLDRAGNAVDARKAQRKREFDEIESELRARQSKALEGLDPNDPRFGMVTKAFDRAMQANNNRRAEADAADAQGQARDLADYQRKNATENAQRNVSLAAQAARLEGRDRDATEIERKAKLQQSLDAIDQDAIEQKRQHAERSVEIDAQAAKDRKSAILGAGLDKVESDMRDAARARIRLDNVTGDTHSLSGAIGQGVAQANQAATATANPLAQAALEGNKLMSQMKSVMEQVRDAIAALNVAGTGGDALAGG